MDALLTDEERQLAKATKVITKLGGSRFVIELAQALGEVSAVCRERGKGTKGNVAVKFVLENVGDRRIVINEGIKQSLPESISRGAIFYEQEGELFDRDPAAPDFFYRVVDAGTGEIRETPAVEVPARESEKPE